MCSFHSPINHKIVSVQFTKLNLKFQGGGPFLKSKYCQPTTKRSFTQITVERYFFILLKPLKTDFCLETMQPTLSQIRHYFEFDVF